MDALPAEPSSSTSQPQPKRPKGRITQEGVQVLEDFYVNVSRYPKKAQREDLTKKMLALPGNEHYKPSLVYNWFKSRRTRDEKAVSQTSIPGQKSSRCPPLTEGAIQHLTTLVKATPYPTTEVVTTWATLLGANVDDILAWMSTKRPEIPNNNHDFYTGNQFNLPTPQSETTSPEPFLGPPSASPSVYFKPEPLASPVISSPSIPSRITVSCFCATLFGNNTVDCYPCLQAVPPRPSTDELLVRALRESLAEAQTLPVEHPRSSDEFNQLFAPYRQTMESFLRAAQDGSLRQLGWDPSMIR